MASETKASLQSLAPTNIKSSRLFPFSLHYYSVEFPFYSMVEAPFNTCLSTLAQRDLNQGRSQGRSWGARDPPFCKPFLTKQPTSGGKNAMTIPWP